MKHMTNVLKEMKEDTISLTEIKRVLSKINIQESRYNNLYNIDNITSPKTIF